MEDLLQNRLMENAKMPNPVVGMGATIIYFSDRKAGTIVEVKGKSITVQEDNAKHIGQPYSNEWELTRNPLAFKQVFTLRKNGRYVIQGDSIKGCSVLIGIRDHHYDYEF